MRASEFNFHLPQSFIALRPVIPRDSCRLLVLHKNGSLEHRKFFNLPEYLSEGDLLVLNDTRVLPARLIGRKRTGGKIEFLLVKELEPGAWEVLSRERYTGKIFLSEDIEAEMSEGKTVMFRTTPSRWSHENSSTVRGSSCRENLLEKLREVGLMPLPPYIKRKPDHLDESAYQTVYSKKTGSIAAPTAGLHFTSKLLAEIERKGVIIRFLTLHIGPGTFKPIRAENLADHRMDAERFEMDTSLIETIRMVKRSGRKLIAVGTTTTRVIEGFFSDNWSGRGNHDGENGSNNALFIGGYTDIFIYPGYRFGLVDSLLTNFHLPGSTPLMLTAAICGKDKLMDAYASAISAGYRFFSYGDAMLIL